MFSLNRVVLIGNVGDDCRKIAHRADGTDIATFKLATSEAWFDDNGQRKEKTEWHQIICKGRLATNSITAVKKGMIVSVEGSIRSRSYKQEDGSLLWKTEILAEKINWLQKPRELDNV